MLSSVRGQETNRSYCQGTRVRGGDRERGKVPTVGDTTKAATGLAVDGVYFGHLRSSSQHWSLSGVPRSCSVLPSPEAPGQPSLRPQIHVLALELLLPCS